MELALTVAPRSPAVGHPVDVWLDVDPGAACSEVAARLLEAVAADPLAPTFVERTGRPVVGSGPVGEEDLRNGDVVVVAPAGGRPGAGPGGERPAAFELRVVGGPEAGRRIPLEEGVLVIGRDRTCTLPLADDQASRQHAELTLSAGGNSRAERRVTVRDLGSTNGTYVDGVRIAERVVVKPEQTVEIGNTHLQVIPITASTERGQKRPGARNGRVPFSRPPRMASPKPSPEFRFPEPPPVPVPRKVPLSSALVPIFMGLVMAYFIGPTMLIFSLMGPVMLGFTLVEDRRSGRRDYASLKAAYDDDIAELEYRAGQVYQDALAARRRAAPDPAEHAARAEEHRPSLWERRPADRDFATWRVGVTDLPSTIRFEGTPDRRDDSAVAAQARDIEARFAIDPSVPVSVDLATVGVLGVASGERSRDALLRWLVAQAATLASPRDLAIVALVPEASVASWEWLKWLPHTATLVSATPGARTVAAGAADARALLAVVEELIAQRRLLQQRRSGMADSPLLPRLLLVLAGEVAVARPALARVLSDGPEFGVYAVAAAASPDLLPGECRAVIADASGGGTGECEPGRVTLSVTTGATTSPITPDGLTLALAERLARNLAPLLDVGAASASAEVPSHADLIDVVGLPEVTPDAIVGRWSDHAGDRGLAAPIGIGSAGVVSIDLRHDGPHGLTAGTTGSGKSEFLQSLVGALASNYPPTRMTFVLVDYKGGAAFKDCVGLPHTVGFFTDLDAHLAKRALVSLNAELRRREHILRANGAKDLIDLERLAPAGAPANLLIVIDEFAFLKKEVPEFVAGIIDIAQRGRSLGVHLMLATQRPSGVVDDNIRANTNLRVALRIADEGDSNDVIDRPDAAHIPKTVPGRAFVRTGHSDVQPVQTAYSGGRTVGGGPVRPTRLYPFELSGGLRGRPGAEPTPGPDDRPTDLQRLVTAVAAAADRLALPRPPRPWLDPLADRYPLADLPGTAAAGSSELSAVVGVVDRPDRQAQDPFPFDLGTAGHLIVYGTSGSGKTTALRTLVIALARRLPPSDLHVYAVDFAGQGLRPLRALPHCGGVVHADQPELVDRLFSLLEQLVSARKAVIGAAGAASLVEHRAAGDSPRLPYVVVALDGYAGFHSTYVNIDRGELVDRFARLVAEGRSAGVHFALTGDRRNAIPTALSGVISARWVLRLADADEYASVGLPMTVAQANLPPGRGFVDDAREVQLGVWGSDPAGAGQAAAIESWAAGQPPAGPGGPVAVAPLPETCTLRDLPAYPGPGLVVPIGVSGITYGPAFLDLDDQPTFAIFGPDRSGRSTTLLTIATSVFGTIPSLPAYLLSPRRSPLRSLPGWNTVATDADSCATLCGELAELVRERSGDADQRVLVVVDDGDELTDGPGAADLSVVVRRGRDAGVVLLMAAQAHVAHRAFGGWLTDVRKAKHGLLLRPDIDADGELFGVRLPHKASRRFPTGRGYVVNRGEVDYVQVAQPAVL